MFMYSHSLIMYTAYPVHACRRPGACPMRKGTPWMECQLMAAHTNTHTHSHATGIWKFQLAQHACLNSKPRVPRWDTTLNSGGKDTMPPCRLWLFHSCKFNKDMHLHFTFHVMEKYQTITGLPPPSPQWFIRAIITRLTGNKEQATGQISACVTPQEVPRYPEWEASLFHLPKKGQSRAAQSCPGWEGSPTMCKLKANNKKLKLFQVGKAPMLQLTIGSVDRHEVERMARHLLGCTQVITPSWRPGDSWDCTLSSHTTECGTAYSSMCSPPCSTPWQKNPGKDGENI